MTVNITGSLLTEALCGPRSAAAGNLQSEQRDQRRPTASPSRYILMKYYYLVWKLRSPSGVLAVIASRYCFKCAFCFCLRVLIYYMRESSCCVTSRRQACRRMKITWGTKTVQLLCGQRKCFLQRIEGLSHLTMIAFLFRVISQFQVISKKLFGQTSLIGWPSYRCVCAWRAAIDFKGRFKQGERGQIVSFFPPPASQQWKSVQVGTTGHPSSSALSSPNLAHTLMKRATWGHSHIGHACRNIMSIIWGIAEAEYIKPLSGDACYVRWVVIRVGSESVAGGKVFSRGGSEEKTWAGSAIPRRPRESLMQVSHPASWKFSGFGGDKLHKRWSDVNHYISSFGSLKKLTRVPQLWHKISGTRLISAGREVSDWMTRGLFVFFLESRPHRRRGTNQQRTGTMPATCPQSSAGLSQGAIVVDSVSCNNGED